MNLEFILIIKILHHYCDGGSSPDPRCRFIIISPSAVFCILFILAGRMYTRVVLTPTVRWSLRKRPSCIISVLYIHTWVVRIIEAVLTVSNSTGSQGSSVHFYVIIVTILLVD